MKESNIQVSITISLTDILMMGLLIEKKAIILGTKSNSMQIIIILPKQNSLICKFKIMISKGKELIQDNQTGIDHLIIPLITKI